MGLLAGACKRCAAIFFKIFLILTLRHKIYFMDEVTILKNKAKEYLDNADEKTIRMIKI